jgi:iron complex outermembrane recepter protein
MKGIGAGRRRVRSVFVPMLLATTALTGVTVPAVAQQAVQTQGGLEIVTVTAEKREENLQRVPVSVQVLGEERLQDLHVVNADDYIKFLPSVSSQSIAPGYTVVHMRGVASGENNNHSGPLPTVGTYLDEQPITTIGGTLDIPIFDVARIEALAGPQGTLYGASSEAGTIRIITNKPDPSAFSASYQLEGNHVDHGDFGYTAEGMVNIPVHDNMAIRIVAWNEHDAGFIDNVPGTRTFPSSGITVNNSRFVEKNYNDVDKLGARAALMAVLSQNWTATASLMGQSETSHGVFAFNPGFPFTSGFDPDGDGPLPPYTAGPVHLGALQVQHFGPEYAHDKWYQAALTVQGKIGNLDLVYSGSHMDRRQNTASDYTDYAYWYDVLYGYGAYMYDNAGHLIDPSQFIRGKDHFTKDSHEIRLSSPADRRFRWVAGLFIERQTHRIEQRYIVHNLTDLFTITGWPDTLWLTLQDRTDRDYAAFGEASFDILPDLTLTAGIRGYEYNNGLVGFFGFNANFSSRTGEHVCFAGPIVPNTPCTDLNKDTIGTGETHKLNLSWRIDDDHMIYATYSTGFRPGGVNRRADFGSYAPDTLTNYEVGWKTTWADGRLRWNGAIYDEEWKAFQFSFLGVNSFTLIANAGDARVQGIESDVSWLPVEGLTLTASGAFTDAKLLQDYCGLFAGGVVVSQCPGPADPNPPQAPKGTRLPVTPRYKANASARYDWPWGDWTAHVQGALAYQSSATPSLRVSDNQILGTQKAFTTVDFDLGVDSEHWSIDAFILNAFDARGEILRYTECTTAVCGQQVYIVPTRPMTVGIRFGQRF